MVSAFLRRWSQEKVDAWMEAVEGKWSTGSPLEVACGSKHHAVAHDAAKSSLDYHCQV